MKLLLTGRIGTSTDLIRDELKKLGAHPVKLYTTAKKPSENDNNFIYIDDTEVENYPDKAFQKIIDGNSYFATERQLEENDVIIVNPDAIAGIASAHPETAFIVVHIVDTGDETAEKLRKLHAGLTDEDFVAKSAAESEEFDKFEELMKDDTCMTHFPENIFIATQLDGSDLKRLSQIVQPIMNTFRYQRNIQVMLRDAIIHEIFPIDDKGRIVMHVLNEDSTPEELHISPDMLACKLMHQDCANSLQYVASVYFGHHDLKVTDDDQ